MGFRATTFTPDKAYTEAKKWAVQLKHFGTSRSAQWAGGADAEMVRSVLRDLRSFKERFTQLAAVPGIVAWAKAQEDDPAYDVVSEFNAMLAAIDASIVQIVGQVPEDASCYMQMYTLNADGSETPRTFPGGALGGIRGTFDAIAATVD